MTENIKIIDLKIVILYVKIFWKTSEIIKMIEEMSDEDIWNLTFGGHDLRKIYSAFKMAQK